MGSQGTGLQCGLPGNDPGACMQPPPLSREGCLALGPLRGEDALLRPTHLRSPGLVSERGEPVPPGSFH